jgi:hypothetical protein
MQIALSIILGVVGGVVGFLPFLLFKGQLRRTLPTDAGKGIIIGLGLTFASLIIMVVEFVLCRFVFHGHLLFFAIPAIVVFLVSVVVYAWRISK